MTVRRQARTTFLEFPEARLAALDDHDGGCACVFSWACPECGREVEGRRSDMGWLERVGGLCRRCLMGDDYDTEE